MQYITKLKLAAVHQICDVEEKSTEFMLQFMQDSCKVSHDIVIAYMALDEKQHSQLFRDVNSFSQVMVQIENSKHFQ